MSTMRTLLFPFLIIAMLLAACSGTMSSPGAEQTVRLHIQKPAETISALEGKNPTKAIEEIPKESELIDILGNLSYTGIFPDQVIQLTDGIAKYDDGSSAKPFVRLINQLIARGELNGDLKEDAVALLEDNTSGTGRFIYAVPVLDVAGNPAPGEALMIGDRISVKSLDFDGAQVVAGLIAQGPGEAACCASWNVRKVFSLEDGRLVEKSSHDLSKVSLNDLSGSIWRLVDLNSLSGEPPQPEAEISLQIADNQLSGLAGCNQYNATVNSQEGSPLSFSVGPHHLYEKALSRASHEPRADLSLPAWQSGVVVV
jgi:hypothetical protein